MLNAYKLAAIGTKSDILDALGSFSGAEKALLDAITAQYDGNVDLASRIMSRELRTAIGLNRAVFADMLAPIHVMRRDMDRVSELALQICAAGWVASGTALRALVAAEAGDRKEAHVHFDEAYGLLRFENDSVIQMRVLQRLALTAYYLQKFDQAVNLAMASAAFATKLGAWRVAAACYSIAYNVEHDVTGDADEADRYARLWHAAAGRTGDESFLFGALVAEYELAVQFAEPARIVSLEAEIKAKLLPQQYAEKYAFAISHAIVRGWTDLRAMRTLLLVLRDTDGRSRGERALCGALAAVASAAIYDDDVARVLIRGSISRLGRLKANESAYERYYRRVARLSLAAACILLGDEVRADRVVAVQEAQTAQEMGNIPRLLRSNNWEAFPRHLRGLSLVFQAAVYARRADALPSGLTPSEFDVLRLLATGMSAVKVAKATGRSVNTIYSHTRSILGKLEASRASEAIAIARQRKMLP